MLIFCGGRRQTQTCAAQVCTHCQDNESVVCYAPPGASVRCAGCRRGESAVPRLAVRACTPSHTGPAGGGLPQVAELLPGLLGAPVSPEVQAARQKLVLQLRDGLGGTPNKQLEALFGEQFFLLGGGC